MAHWLTNPTRNYEVAGSIPGLAQRDKIRHCHELWCRRSLDPMLLWLWLWPAATAPIRPLAWELTYAEGAALEKAKRQKKNKNKHELTGQSMVSCYYRLFLFIFYILSSFPYGTISIASG